MKDLIIVAVLVLIVGSALAYIIKAKKSGVRCIGCNAGGNCSCCTGNCNGSKKQNN